MFGSKKIQELESQLRSLEQKLNQETSEKTSLAHQLESANSRIADLEGQLHDFDLEKMKTDAANTCAEYEGLKELYKRKNQEFDDSKEEEEQIFAREQAVKRLNLENEIRDNRLANQEYVAETVKTFGESYNYYLNQIKLLMDALSTAATRTGEALFAPENANLKESFGTQLREKLKSGMEDMGTDTGDLILIGAEEEVPPVEEVEETIEEAPEAVEGAVEEVADKAEEVVEEAVEDAGEAVEAAGEAIEGTVILTKETVENAAEAAEEAVDKVEDTVATFVDEAKDTVKVAEEAPVNFRNLYQETLAEDN